LSWQDNVRLLLSTKDKTDRQKVIDAINKKIAQSAGTDQAKQVEHKVTTSIADNNRNVKELKL